MSATISDFFKDKAIFITGASSGIGKDLAILFSTFGARLALLARRKELLEEVKSECEKNGGEVLVYIADVVDRAQMGDAAKDILSKWGLVDIVIANAGVGGLNPGDNFSLDIHKKFVDINIIGLANTLVPFIDSMKKRREGHLVGISSLAAFRGLPKGGSYSSTKAAQAILLESLRVDLKKYNISVSSIHPGFIETPMTDHQEFNMPFLMPVRKSSILVARAIMKKKSQYLYPWQMRLLTFLNQSLPNRLYDYLIPRLSGQKEKVNPREF